MSNIQTGAERMPHDLSHLGFLAGQIGRLITISTTPVIAGDSFEMDAVGALRLSPLRRGLAIDSTVDIFTFYVPHRHVYGEQWIKFMKDGVNATPLPTSLHFHAVHFMRTLPTGSVDPNFGRRVRNRRQLNSLQNTWPYGYSMPIAVRYTQDAFSRSGWLWPVDAKGEPLKATSY